MSVANLDREPISTVKLLLLHGNFDFAAAEVHLDDVLLELAKTKASEEEFVLAHDAPGLSTGHYHVVKVLAQALHQKTLVLSKVFH